VAAVVTLLAAGASGRVMSPHRWLRIAACRSCARAVRAVCRQIASYVLAWEVSQPRVSFPVLKVSSVGHC
jgi:hypothetical protein